MPKKPGAKAYFMISAVAQKYNIHPQTLRLYEREGLLKPSRTEGNTRLYSEDDLEQLETILSLTRDLGVNLAGVEIILNMRGKIEAMQLEVNEFMDFVKRELSRGLGDWEQRLGTALVKSSPTDLVRLELDPIAHRFARESRIRLTVAGGSHPRWERNLGTGDDPAMSTRMLPSRRTIDLSASRVVLPVVTSPG